MNGHNQIESIIDAQGSVKQGDRLPFVGNGYLTINLVPDDLFTTVLPPTLPPGLWERDRILLSTARHESFWRAALNIATAKFATMGWEVESDMPTIRKRYQQIIVNSEAVGQVGWSRFSRAFVRTFLCTKAAIVEIARESHSMGSRIVGLHHLDPMRCLLTNDPDTPVIYQSLDGKWHEMKWWQVGVFSDMPDVTETNGGAGICAAEGAYQHIRKLAAIEQYFLDKVTGRRALSLQLVSGMSINQIDEAVSTAKTDALRKGWVQYMGNVIVATNRNEPVTNVTIDLASVPDGFDRKQEFDIALLAYADNVGLDPQDLQPLTGQALGTGAQSQVLDEKSKGRGLKLLAEDLAKWFNEFVLPDSVQFSWYSKDLRDEKAQAENMKLRAEWGEKMVDKGILTSDQVTNILVDYGDIPADYRPIDTLNTGNISDDEKPEVADVEGQETEDVEQETAAAGTTQTKATLKPTPSQRKRASKLMDEELARARRLYREVA